MNTSETLFLHEDGDHVLVASIDGSIYGIGYTSEDAIEDAMDHGVTEEELEGLASEDCVWEDDCYDGDDYL